jgi:hypothetical protein
MQTVQSGTYPGKSSILFLPMIDMNPSDMSCIYSTLHFVESQAKKLSVAPVLTFDQPLYWKAIQIVTNEPKHSGISSFVIRLIFPYSNEFSWLHWLLDAKYWVTRANRNGICAEYRYSYAKWKSSFKSC